MRLFVGLTLLFNAILGGLDAQTVKQLKHIPKKSPGQKIEIHPLTYFNVISREGGKDATLYDNKGNKLSDQVYATFEIHSKTGIYLASVKENDKVVFGFVDAKGSQKIPFIYDVATPFKDGMALCKSKGEFFQVDTLGNTKLIPGQFEQLTHFRPGVFSHFKDRKQGLIDENGNVLLPAKYGSIVGVMHSHLFYVWKGDIFSKSALLNNKNEVVIPFDVQVIVVRREYIEVQKGVNGDQGPKLYFDLEGKPLPSTPKVELVEEKLPNYIYKKRFANGAVMGLQDSINKKPLTQLEFSSLCAVKYGLLSFDRTNYALRTSGYMRYSGEIVIEKPYFLGTQLSPFDILTYNSTRNTGRWYDQNGKEILPDYFKKLASNCVHELPTINDTAKIVALGVSLEGKKFGLYDRSGKPITAEIYDTLAYVNHRLFQFKNKDRKGLVNAKGEELKTVKFDEVKSLNIYNRVRPAYPWLQFFYQKKMGLMTEEGKVVLPAEFEPYAIYLRAGKYLWAIKEDGIYIFEVL